MNDEITQRVLLASHRAQLNGIEQSIAQIERQKLDGTLTAEVADQMIARWRPLAEHQQVCVNDCLRNLGELPEETPVEPIADESPVVVKEEQPSKRRTKKQPAAEVDEQPVADEPASDTDG